MELNLWIRLARKRAGMSQLELADALRISKSCISAWETCRNQPRWSQMLEIRAATGAPLPVSNRAPGEAGRPWPFRLPRSRLDRLTDKQLAEVGRILAAAIALAAKARKGSESGGSPGQANTAARQPP